MSIKSAMIEALSKKYEADIAEADATIKIYFEQSVGIGEHPQHLEEVDKLLQKIAAEPLMRKDIKLHTLLVGKNNGVGVVSLEMHTM
jgi:hypothetical protein